MKKITEIEITLWNSLAKTGLGHGTDIGILLGISGENFVSIDSQTINKKINKIKEEKRIYLLGTHPIYFDIKKHLVFQMELNENKHPNQIDFKIKMNGENNIFKDTYYSVGGGFVENKKKSVQKNTHEKTFPYPIEKAIEILRYCQKEKMEIDEIILANELSHLKQFELESYIEEIAGTMMDSIYEGCHTKGILPGGLNVVRRAFDLNKKLMKGRVYHNQKEWFDAVKSQPRDFRLVTRFISCFALAVNEVNAGMGRIVTAPTNGAAGVIPSVFMYYCCFVNPEVSFKERQIFFLVASEIGSLFKKNASISAASGGCQAEIGVSSSMAAAGLTRVMGGDTEQVLMAAEIAMEHHLGLTCDPIKGLVQIPCIERNSMGAIKAITASEIALNSKPDKAIVKLDDVIKTMWDTAKDMNNKYKETSEGGLAINIPINVIEC